MSGQFVHLRTHTRLSIGNSTLLVAPPKKAPAEIVAKTIPEMCKESWQGFATAYNEKNNTNATGEIFASGYVQRYMDVNSDVISKIPETLIKEFREVAGEETTKTMTAEFVKIGQNVLNTKDVDATVYGAVCYMLLTAEDNTMKISLK